MSYMIRPKYMKTARTEEIPYPGNGSDDTPELSWLKSELNFIVGIYEIESAVFNNVTRSLHCFMESLNRAFRMFDIQEILYHTVRLSEKLQCNLVQGFREKMNKRKMRNDTAPGNLLVATERHLP